MPTTQVGVLTDNNLEYGHAIRQFSDSSEWAEITLAYYVKNPINTYSYFGVITRRNTQQVIISPKIITHKSGYLKVELKNAKGFHSDALNYAPNYLPVTNKESSCPNLISFLLKFYKVCSNIHVYNKGKWRTYSNSYFSYTKILLSVTILTA